MSFWKIRCYTIAKKRLKFLPRLYITNFNKFKIWINLNSFEEIYSSLCGTQNLNYAL